MQGFNLEFQVYCSFLHVFLPIARRISSVRTDHNHAAHYNCGPDVIFGKSKYHGLLSTSAPALVIFAFPPASTEKA